MAQYSILDTSGTATIELTDGSYVFRLQIRGQALFTDIELGRDGFDGPEDVDWANIDSASLPGVNQERFRVGVRDAHWVVDQSITETGFSGAQGIDWALIEQHKF